MTYKYTLWIILLSLFTACGGGEEKDSKKKDDSNQTIESEELNTSFKTSSKTITLYIHGYRQEGFKKDGDYGRGWYNTFYTNLKDFTELPAIDYEDIKNFDKDNFYNF